MMKNAEIPEMNTLIECTNSLVKQGFTAEFQVTEFGLKALSDKKLYSASDITISNYFRFESATDPSDNAIVYVIETHDGKKGMLIDAYGVSADARISEFVKQVEDFHKKVR
jgi:hypothetical protein